MVTGWEVVLMLEMMDGHVTGSSVDVATLKRLRPKTRDLRRDLYCESLIPFVDTFYEPAVMF